VYLNLHAKYKNTIIITLAPTDAIMIHASFPPLMDDKILGEALLAWLLGLRFLFSFSLIAQVLLINVIRTKRDNKVI